MVFTLEQNKFLMIFYYRNGVKRDEKWTYSLQACKEEFLAKYLHQNVLEKCLTAHIYRILIILFLLVVLKRGNRRVIPR
jgi:hypothetical protein